MCGATTPYGHERRLTSTRITKQPARAISETFQPINSTSSAATGKKAGPLSLMLSREMTQAQSIQGPTRETGCSSDFCCWISCVTATSPANNPWRCSIALSHKSTPLEETAALFAFVLFWGLLTTLHVCSGIISVTFLLTVYAPWWLYLRQAASASRSKRDAWIKSSSAVGIRVTSATTLTYAVILSHLRIY